MSLYKVWNQKVETDNHEELREYLIEYYEKEKKAYAIILEEKNNIVSGSVKNLAEKFNMESFEIAGFIDGINESLAEKVNLDDLSEETEVTLNIVWPELYKNMHKAKADWLYNLPEWDNILTEEERNTLTKEYRKSVQAVTDKEAGRNDPCPCGSGKKYKKCCGKNL